MECLKHIHSLKDIRVVPTSKGTPTKESASLTELSVECAGSPEVSSLKAAILSRYVGDMMTGRMDLEQVLHGVFSTAFAYGCRVGIEMERVDLPEEL